MLKDLLHNCMLGGGHGKKCLWKRTKSWLLSDRAEDHPLNLLEAFQEMVSFSEQWCLQSSVGIQAALLQTLFF